MHSENKRNKITQRQQIAQAIESCIKNPNRISPK